MLTRNSPLDSSASHLASFRELFILHPCGAAVHLFYLVSHDE